MKATTGDAYERSVRFDFDEFRDQIALLHTHYQDLLRKYGLEKLSAVYKAFPVSYEGVSLIVLLPHDLKPKEASKLSAEAAAKKIVVLRVTKQHCLKIWPAEIIDQSFRA